MTNYPHLQEYKDKQGNWRVYYRFNGKKIRLRAPKYTAAFQVEYDRAASQLNSSSAPLSDDTPWQNGKWRYGSFGWLVEQYFKSDAFKSLSPKTQSDRRYTYTTMVHEPCEPGSKHVFGEYTAAEMRPTHIMVLRDIKVKEGALSAANKRVKELSGTSKNT
jgi:hypothetical protein